jgi:hypothetical protein
MVFSGMILGFVVSKKREITKSKEYTSNSKHATTQESITNSNIQWDGTILQMFYKNPLLLLWHLSLN